MKRAFALILCLSVLPAFAQDGSLAQSASEVPLTPTPAPAMAHWDVSKVPWDDWFKDHATVKEKAEYVYFFWNAQDVKLNFEVKDKKKRLAEAALEMVRRMYPAGSQMDQLKVDIVYVLERDSYGAPKWDSIQQVAHLEFKRSKMPKAVKKPLVATSAVMKKVFEKFEVF
ncbi:MAG TPA: hypothetical protein VHE12_04235 [bacterium]|nr:hypothetical protein [bacterium]